MSLNGASLHASQLLRLILITYLSEEGLCTAVALAKEALSANQTPQNQKKFCEAVIALLNYNCQETHISKFEDEIQTTMITSLSYLRSQIQYYEDFEDILHCFQQLRLK